MSLSVKRARRRSQTVSARRRAAAEACVCVRRPGGAAVTVQCESDSAVTVQCESDSAHMAEREPQPQVAVTARDVTVRDATPEDMPLLQQLIRDLAAFEDMPEGARLTADDLVEDGFRSEPAWFVALVAEREGEGAVLGYALCSRAYSSWTGRALYLEDLFVVPGARRAGVGRALLRAVCERAVRMRATRLDWHVLRDNAPALAFYARLGAQDLCAAENRTAMRLYADRIAAVARGHLLPAAPAPAPAPQSQ